MDEEREARKRGLDEDFENTDESTGSSTKRILLLADKSREEAERSEDTSQESEDTNSEPCRKAKKSAKIRIQSSSEEIASESDISNFDDDYAVTGPEKKKRTPSKVARNSPMKPTGPATSTWIPWSGRRRQR